MHPAPELLDTLHTLHLLWPAQGLLHAGAGLPNPDAWYLQLPLPADARIDCIEADPHRQHLLAQAAAQHPRIHIHQAMLGASNAPATFHAHSNGNESSALPAQALVSFWPNNGAVESTSMQQSTLDTFAAQHLAQADQANWLHIDCLPATAIAQGASALLQHVDVVLARVITQPLPPAHPLTQQGATLAELTDYLQTKGFVLHSTHEERHPAFATAIHVRDHRSAHQQAAQQRNAETTAKAELQTQLNYAQASNAELIEKQELQAQAQQALQVDLTKISQAKDVESKARAELQAKCEKLQAEQQETNHRQKLLEEEIRKAEVQLKLLEELLLQDEADIEPGNEHK